MVANEQEIERALVLAKLLVAVVAGYVVIGRAMAAGRLGHGQIGRAHV